MKKLSALLLACALFSPVALFAANFEGNVRYKITTGKNVQNMDYKIKDGVARIDVQTKDTTASVIIDPPKQEMTILIPAQNMYMVQSLAGKGAASTGNVDTSKISFEKTSTTEKILGYDCTKYITKTKDATSEIWATEELGMFMGMAPGGGGGVSELFGGSRRSSSTETQGWATALAGKNFFPLRVVSQNSSGKETTRMEATAVEKASLPASDFAPPAGFQKLDMGAMMRGMIPGR